MLSNKVFDFSIPVRVHFEVGGVSKIDGEIRAMGGTSVLIVTDKGVIGADLLGAITTPLEREGLNYTVFDEVEPDPSLETIEKGVGVLKEKGCDIIVGIGGGSPIDSAKAIAILTANPGPLTQYEGPDKVPNPVLPIVAIPTTAGTGSEINGSTVITDKARKYKMSIRSSFLVPKLALLDPSLLRSLPPTMVASTGIDALVHAVESYISLGSNPATEGLAIESIRLISENLRAFYASPENIEPASKMLLASSMACMSFANARLGVIHGIAHVLGGRYNIAHGIACAVLLPYAMNYCLIGAIDKFVRIAEVMGEPTAGLTKMESAESSVKAVRKLMMDLDMPQNLSQLGVNEEDIAKIAEAALSSGMHLTTPRKMGRNEIEVLIKEAM
jgi:alcohol dehydrogenase class IV